MSGVGMGMEALGRPAWKRSGSRFSLEATRKRLFAAQTEEYALMKKRRAATERGEKLGPRLERKLSRVREHIDEIRSEMFVLDEEVRREA